ncbi:M48 family metalloprotease [bacterium]|nr:M48 family metalloprotease [bacterium]RQV96344.1 MAG: hypothetical protein EH221_05075 [bacterium]
MTSFVYNLGRKAGHVFWKGHWWYKSLFGTEEEALQAEYIVGRQIDGEIYQQYPQETNKNLQDFVNSIGFRLIAKLKDKKRLFHFRILSNIEFNAFALPGGFIYCTQALLELCQMNQDEIAFVLAHEIAHVVKKHAFKRVLMNASLNILSNLGKTSSALGSITKQTIQKMLRSGYSQDQESEADRFAVQMMIVAGYNPNSSICFLKKLKKNESNEKSISFYLSSHPAFNDRIETIGEMIKRKTQSAYKIDKVKKTIH